jgi:hypothetical protein
VAARTSSASFGSLVPTLVENSTAGAEARSGLVAFPAGLDRFAQGEVILLGLGRPWEDHTAGCLEVLSESKVSVAGLAAVGMLQKTALAATGRSVELGVGTGSPVVTRQLLGPGGC